MSRLLPVCDAIAANAARYLFAGALQALREADSDEARLRASFVLNGHLDSLWECSLLSGHEWKEANAEVYTFVWGPRP
ncbi:hypothetical protein EA797_04360 [Stutzerimonas zhaodongensis]|uniref:Uncharacterized protein n=1 Tax=Stutzerimonas zhaodongensis TaxID=1176257 RepID=A0A3M2HVY6_9GAMM|nr:hypothetical protein [Stutzerimonas zhaodongensis]MCQ4314452.1 hypothetical protein [Stutzerimonas zhaodongensis]RMH91973.1 hypothetical protein EA797_04360 [Stutzerimonas zhaodongensis]